MFLRVFVCVCVCVKSIRSKTFFFQEVRLGAAVPVSDANFATPKKQIDALELA